jgi:hypothetical protein
MVREDGIAFLPAGRATDMPDPYRSPLAAGGSTDFVGGVAAHAAEAFFATLDVMWIRI